MGMTALAAPLQIAGLGLGAYGAYESTKAQQRAEDRQKQAEAEASAARDRQRNELGALLNQYRGQIQQLPTSGYSPEEVNNLKSQVDFGTGEKSKEFSTSLLNNFLGRNINPASGAVTEASSKIISDLQKNKQNQFYNIEQSSLNQKKLEEAAKRKAEQGYLDLASRGIDNATNSDLSGIQEDLGNFNTIQGQKGKNFSDLSSSLLSSTAQLQDPNKNIIPGVDFADLNPLRFLKRKPSRQQVSSQAGFDVGPNYRGA